MKRRGRHSNHRIATGMRDGIGDVVEVFVNEPTDMPWGNRSRIVTASTIPMSPTKRSLVTARGCSVIANGALDKPSRGPRTSMWFGHALTSLMGIEQMTIERTISALTAKAQRTRAAVPRPSRSD